MRTHIELIIWTAGIVAAGVAIAAAPNHPAHNPSVGPDDPTQPPPSFNRDIRPILAGRCYKCHGPDDAAREAQLRLDTREGATAQLEPGFAAIVPGDATASELITRVAHADEDERMPPPEAGERLSKKEINLLRRWIDSGAPWERHWSFVPVANPTLPAATGAPQSQNPIDAYVLARLEQEGLSPSREADRYTLIRRVSLDLIGLPPTPAEVEEFVNDDREDAYEHLVDRLLASPRFGERWASVWLDLARYADTMGYEKDLRRTIWPYRDWVIRAFNEDAGFDQFTIDQLAGDLLPEPTQAQRVATAFHRNTMTNDEGGTDDEEFRVAAVIDRVNTTMQAWMGVTAGCAQCHTHKFDPITHENYYQLFAFFNQSRDADRTDEEPRITVPTKEQAARLAELQAALERIESRADEAADAIEYTEPQTLAIPASGTPVDYFWIDDRPPRGVKLEAAGDGNAWHWVDSSSHPTASGSRATRRSVAQFGQHYFTDAPNPLKIHKGDQLIAHVYLDPDNPPREIMIQWHSVAKQWKHRAYWGENIINFGAENTTERLRLGTLPHTDSWIRLEIDPASVGLEAGDEIDGWAFSQHAGTVYWDAAGLRTSSPPDDRELYSRRAWEESARTSNSDTLPESIAAALAVDQSQRSDDQRAQLHRYYIRNVYAPAQDTFLTFENESQEIQRQINELTRQIPSIPIMADLDPEAQRSTHVFDRGSFLSPLQEVQPGVPESIGSPISTPSPNRLDLARWIVSHDNPLTARVTVNRIWEQFFGIGIVETSEDFGTQGTLPTHPELLDDLAWRFMEDGWSFKNLCRRIVTSETYRQSSDFTPELLQRDPRNRLLARGPRFRLRAETVRDQALAVSGLLSDKMFGPPVFPPQPEGVWQIVYSGDRWRTSMGEDRHRRALYTFLRRTSPYPSMTTFDAPSREVCTLRRIHTNTPLQALVTLNDPVYIEAAQALARLIMEQDDSPDQRAGHAVMRVLSRPATTDETAELVRLYESELAHFRSNLDDAAQLASNPIGPIPDGLDPAQLAAWTVVCNVILNLDEVLTRN